MHIQQRVEIRKLLESHPRHRTAHAALLADLLDLLSEREPQPETIEHPAIEPLSDAELRVLRFLPTNLPASAIATEVYVSVNTVKTHMRHIYAKLDAHSRVEAVSRARALGLLAGSSRHA